jgi:cation diffusion facilitator family transporter
MFPALSARVRHGARERYTESVNEGQRIALLGVAVSASLALIKIVVGVLSSSNSLLADGFESAGDVMASALVWLGLRYAAKPPDTEHPYGHGRAEMLSGLVVGFLLSAGGVAIAAEALVNAGLSRVPPGYALYPLILSVVIKVAMARMKRNAGRRIRSAALTADAWNDAVDILSGLVALSAIALNIYDPSRFARFDHYGAAVVGMIMIWIGVRVARRTGSELMDTMPDDAFLERIRAVALEVSGADGVEKVFARKTGLGYHVDLHLRVDPEMTVRDSHALAHEVQQHIRERIKHVAAVLIHVEPTGLEAMKSAHRAESPHV